MGREAELRQDVLGHGPDDLPRRPRRADRAGLAEGQARGPRRRGPRRARRRSRRRASGDRAGNRARLRSWGETSEASAGRVLPRPDPRARRRRTPRDRRDAGPMTEPPAPRRPRLAAGPVHGHRRPSRRRRLRAGRDGRPLDRRRAPRAGWCAARAATRAARTPTPTRSSSPPCASASSAPRPRSSATPA